MPDLCTADAVFSEVVTKLSKIIYMNFKHQWGSRGVLISCPNTCFADFSTSFKKYR